MRGYGRFRVSKAWSFFGDGNGVGSLEVLRKSIDGYRDGSPEPDPVIGCSALRDVFLAPPAESQSAPSDSAENIVRFERSDLGPRPSWRSGSTS